MLTPSKPLPRRRSPARTLAVTFVTVLVLVAVAGGGWLVTQSRAEHRRDASAGSTPPVVTTTATSTSAAGTTSASAAPGTVAFLALPIGTPPSEGSEARYPWHALVATLHGPATAPAGGSIEFTVALRNPTTAPIDLDPCPAYEISVGLHTDSYGLNCAGAPTTTIAPGQSLAFAVQVWVPYDVSTGSDEAVTFGLGWQPTSSSPHARVLVRIT